MHAFIEPSAIREQMFPTDLETSPIRTYGATRNPRSAGGPRMICSTFISMIRFAAAAAVLGACTAMLWGCETTRLSGYYRPLPPKPRPLQPAPPDARADALVLNVSPAPQDTDGNGYPDLINATAHLFDRRYPPAIYQDGAFIFAMFAPGDVSRPGAEPLHEWRVDNEQFQRARGRSAFGQCYRFRLSMLDNGGTDEVALPVADIVCVFEPADRGEPTWSGEVATIQIGRRVRVPRFHWQVERDPSTDLGAWP